MQAKKSNSKNGLKRRWGMALLSLGCAMCCVLFVCSLFKQIADSNTALDVIYATFAVGCMMLGLNTYEKIKTMINGISK